jgi:hypothetical protein
MTGQKPKLCPKYDFSECEYMGCKYLKKRGCAKGEIPETMCYWLEPRLDIRVRFIRKWLWELKYMARRRQFFVFIKSFVIMLLKVARGETR